MTKLYENELWNPHILLSFFANTRPEPEKKEEPEPAPAPKAKEKPKPKAKTQPKRAASAKQKAPEPEPDDMEESEEEEMFGDVDDEDDEEESSDEERELDMETFDTQNLVKDEEDRKYLDSLPEFEREAILGERFEKLKAEQDMKKALREAKGKKKEEKAPAKATRASKRKAEPKAKAPPKKKAKAAEADTSNDADIAAQLAGVRGSSRNKDAKGSKSKKAAALAALREERKSVLESKKDESEESDLDFGDDDDDSDDDYEESGALKPWQQKKKQRSTISRLDQMDVDSDASSVSERVAATDEAPVSQKAAPPAELEDFIKVTVPRRRLARWCNEPFFEQAVKESFVRLFLGEDDYGEKAYRLCQIVAVKDGEKSYNFPTANRREKPVSLFC